MYEKVLLKLGLSLREIKIYSSLLVEDEILANQLAKKTGLIRTNVYDILNNLIQKGLVAYVIKNNKKFFRATEPEKLVDYVESKQNEFEETKTEIIKILPTLKFSTKTSSKPIIEVYEGKEGMKTILAMSIRESLKTNKEMLGISVQQEQCRLLAGPYHIRWYAEREKNKIRARYLMSSEQSIITVKHTKFKILPKEAKNPNEIFIFGDITTQFFFTGDQFTGIVIKSKEITDSYRDYFDFLWKFVD